jgi:hypothetical protein
MKLTECKNTSQRSDRNKIRQEKEIKGIQIEKEEVK